MFDVIKSLPESSTWISIFSVYVALPYLYLTLSTDVQKEYCTFVHDVALMHDVDQREFNAVVENLREHLHVFDVDWWFIGAIALLFTIILNLPALAIQSHYSNCHRDSLSRLTQDNCSRDIKEEPELRGSGLDASRSIQCKAIRSALVAYGIAVGLVLGFVLWWARLSALKQLRAYYAKMSRASSLTLPANRVGNDPVT